MAQLRPRTRSLGENCAPEPRGSKTERRPPVGEQPQAAKRRALGDIGNIHGPSASTRQQTSKAKAQQHAEQGQQQGQQQPPAASQQTGAAQPIAPPSPQLPRQRCEQHQNQQQQQQQRSRSRPPAHPSRSRSAAAAAPQQQASEAAAEEQPAVRVTRSRSRSLAGAGDGPPVLPTSAPAAAAAAARPRRSRGLPDIDAVDRSNPLAACDYVNDVYSYYRRTEGRFRVPCSYMDRQEDINEKMRCILIDWLVDVHVKFKLLPETLFLTINLIDRYLSAVTIERERLQLVGSTAMLIASKYEEVWAPEVKDFVFITDKAYTQREILAMEKDMLKTLDYSLTLATTYQYLARLLKAAGIQYKKQMCLYVAYCAELCLGDYDMLRYSYSEQAAGIMYTALAAFRCADWYPRVLEQYACIPRGTARTVAERMVGLLLLAPQREQQAVVKKYSSEKYCQATSVQVPTWVLQEAS